MFFSEDGRLELIIIRKVRERSVEGSFVVDSDSKEGIIGGKCG